MIPRLLPLLSFAIALAFAGIGLSEVVKQREEDAYVRQLTREALAGARGPDVLSRAEALRDFVRARVSGDGFSSQSRPFLRDSAAGTLRSGKGRCGEATRAFFNMASSAGISARRLYLEGDKPHVVALVNDAEGRPFVVDASNVAQLPETVTLENLAAQERFTSYSTVGWRRLSVLRALPSNAIDLGPLNYLFENPRALAAFVWILLAACALTLTSVLLRKLSGATQQPAPEHTLAFPSRLKGESAEV